MVTDSGPSSVCTRSGLDLGTQALAGLLGCLAGAVPDHQRELLTAVAGQQLVLAHDLAHGLRDLTQDEIAGLMPVGVVEPLEVVDVDHDHADHAVPVGAAAPAISRSR